MKSATDFHAAFLKAFEKMREPIGSTQWKCKWTHPKHWSQLMIYGRDPKAVVRAVADSFDDDLQCWEERPYEPLHLDAVFHAKNSRSWFPIHVAIEHENDPSDFCNEIQKLLSVRCQLKVGITYALVSDSSQSHQQERIAGEIRREFDQANNLTHEDGATEYLFLLGYEINTYELQWRKLIFNAATGPAGQSFQ